MGMKVFKFCECDWVCAQSLAEATDFYREDTGLNSAAFELGVSVEELSLDEKINVPFDDFTLEEKGRVRLGEMIFSHGEMRVEMTLSRLLEVGGHTEPCIIYSTEV